MRRSATDRGGGRGSFAGGVFLLSGGMPSPFLAAWSSPIPFLVSSQPLGAATSVLVSNHWLMPGHDHYNITNAFEGAIKALKE